MVRNILSLWTRLRPKSKQDKLFLTQLKSTLGIVPFNINLFKTAFTHKTYQIKNNLPDNFERLEFIGDSVLGSIVSDLLYQKFSNFPEGKLTEMRSKIVNRKMLNQIGYKLGINVLLFTTETKRIDENNHLFGNVLEAVVGAHYLDFGYEKTKIFVNKKILNPFISLEMMVQDVYSYKNLLLQWVVKNQQEIEFVDKQIDAPNKKGHWYEVVVLDKNANKEWGKAISPSKKEASKLAAERAVSYLTELGEIL